MSVDKWNSIGVPAEVHERLREEVARTGLPVWRVIQDAVFEVDRLRERVTALEAEVAALRERAEKPLILPGEARRRFEAGPAPGATPRIEAFRRAGPVTTASRWIDGGPFGDSSA